MHIPQLSRGLAELVERFAVIIAVSVVVEILGNGKKNLRMAGGAGLADWPLKFSTHPLVRIPIGSSSATQQAQQTPLLLITQVLHNV
jgi:hypothetical protein